MSYGLKPALSFDEQLDRLKKRNMLVNDDAEAVRILSRTNYYRLSGYAYMFRQPDESYKQGTDFDLIVRLMDFDTQLRRVLIEFLERVEIYARTQIAYWFSMAHEKDGGAHYNPSLFQQADRHAEYLHNLKEQLRRNSKQLFVAHHIQAFDGKMPLWSAVKLLSFSTLSKLYSNMLPADKARIAANMNTDASHLSNWLHCFSVLRNACAHYSRLYGTICSPKASLNPSLLRRRPDIKQDTLFAYVIAMIRFMPEASEKDRLVASLKTLFERFSQEIDLCNIGFPTDWESVLRDHKVNTLKPIALAK